MRASVCRNPLRTVALTVITAVVALGQVIAQGGSPRPRVALTRVPTLFHNVWPGDFNNDGKTDLVAGQLRFSPAPRLVLRLGRGDGTFGDETVISSRPQRPLAVGDFNKDGNRDLLITDTDQSTPPFMYVLPGNGNGTFGSAVLIGQGDSARDAAVADFNGDGNADFVVGGSVYPGRGNLTFDAPVTLGAFVAGGTAAFDVNGDSRTDVIIANADSGEVDVFFNQGSLLFTPLVIPLGSQVFGVTAWDLNGDGSRDLIASTADPDNESTFEQGRVHVILNNGNGTFKTAVVYETERGPLSIVGGDFNGDGKVDVATGNQSGRFDSACDSRLNLWDSVSILPGNGDGTLGTRASFSLAYTSFDETYVFTQHSLNVGPERRSPHRPHCVTWCPPIERGPGG